MCKFYCGGGDLAASATEMRRNALVELRVRVRQMLYEINVMSNPAVDEEMNHGRIQKTA